MSSPFYGSVQEGSRKNTIAFPFIRTVSTVISLEIEVLVCHFSYVSLFFLLQRVYRTLSILV